MSTVEAEDLARKDAARFEWWFSRNPYTLDEWREFIDQKMQAADQAEDEELNRKLRASILAGETR